MHGEDERTREADGQTQWVKADERESVGRVGGARASGCPQCRRRRAAASPKPPLLSFCGLSLVPVPPSLAKKIETSRKRVPTIIWDTILKKIPLLLRVNLGARENLLIDKQGILKNRKQ